MIILYNLSIFLLSLGVRLVTGRKAIFKRLEESVAQHAGPVIWMHCASLGEFEQGRPVIEAIKKEFPKYKILLTFFSPSGYEVRKSYTEADMVYYLPWDTAGNASKFISIVKPVAAIFIKYEFWFHFSKELKKKNIVLLSISSIFRKDQLFFQNYGRFSRNILKNFTHFFVQNHESINLLKSIGVENCTRSGDTRFDRVHQIVKQGHEIAIAHAFKANQKVFVVGSCWPEDLDVLIPFINENKLKFIVAPHELSESSITGLIKSLEVNTIRYSDANENNVEDCQVLVIDNMGMLSRLYRYGEFAYIGGAFGKGLHNILEAACYGVPILFGNKNYEKFQEAMDLINRGGAFEVADYPDLKNKYEMLNLPENFLLACEVTRQYVEENLGATERIMKYCRKLL
ncbi:MAG: 3-deoxy-D-manno-octulosonic acid transferase [Bacteroidota bacterium]